VFMPRVPNPYDDEAQRAKRLEAQSEESPLRSWTLFIGGWVALVAFGVLMLVGLPGAGLILVPIGIGLILGGGIPLFLDRLSS
jgi:hypothetical protein